MGVDKLGMYALEYVYSKFDGISDVCSIGRQELQITENFYIKFLKKTYQFHKLKLVKNENILPKHFNPPSYDSSNNEKFFFEKFFSVIYNSKVTDSLDTTKYEGCTIAHDMNIPIKSNKKFDLVFDFGSMEHIFNTAQVMDNIIEMCNHKGIIIHVVPSNQMSGHGFHQFSPELFFNVYSEERGFLETSVFLVESSKPAIWHKCRNPKDIKERLCAESKSEVYVVSISKKNKKNIKSLITYPIQQNDWVDRWEGHEINPLNSKNTKEKIKNLFRFKIFIDSLWVSDYKNLQFLDIIIFVKRIFNKFKNNELLGNHKHLTKYDIVTLIKNNL